MSERTPPNLPGAGRRPVLWPFFVATFLIAAGGGLIFPLLGELQDANGLPTWGLGLISATYFVGAVSGQLVLAPYADRGHTRRLMLIGAALSVVAMVLFAFGGALWELSLARLLSGLAAGSFLPATRAALVRTDPDRAGHLLGRYSGTETGGFVFGPVIGTALFELWGLAAPFLILAAAIGAITVVLARTPMPREGVATPTLLGSEGTVAEVPAAAAPKGTLRATLGLLRHRGVMVAVLLEVAVFLPSGIYDAMWARYLDDRGATTLFIGLGLTLYGVPFVLWAPRGGRLADRLGPVRAATLGMVVIVPTTAFYGVLTVPLVINGIALIEAVGNATSIPAAQTAMARSCPPAQLATGQGLSGSISLLAAGAAAGVAAPVYELTGPEVLFGGAAVVMALLVVGAQLLDRKGGVRAVPGAVVPVDPLPAVPEPG